MVYPMKNIKLRFHDSKSTLSAQNVDSSSTIEYFNTSSGLSKMQISHTKIIEYAIKIHKIGGYFVFSNPS